MKKIVYFLLFVLCLPTGLMAQNAEDDLYFVPSKNKKEKEEVSTRKVEPQKQVTAIYASPGSTVVVNDRLGKCSRDIDEYNRRYDADDNDFEMNHDMLYIKRKKEPELEGEWVTGDFEGTQEDYEYAERIIRFRNPRFAISISSPIYWDIVYGPGAWDWNVYTDGFYAYAFPTYSNPLWWNWRYNSFSWNWNYGWGWGYPYCSWSYASGYWNGWHSGYWGHYHHHYHHPYWGWGGGRPYYASRSVINGNNRSYYSGFRGSGSSNRRNYGVSSSRPGHSSVGQSVRRSGVSGGRVVGTRSNSGRSNSAVRGSSSYSRRNTQTYTRPSSTRSSGSYNRSSGTVSHRNSGVENNRKRNSSYSRGSSSVPSTRQQSDYSGSSRRSGSSYSPRNNSGSYSRSSGSVGGGSYSRGGGSSHSSGGGSHRR